MSARPPSPAGRWRFHVGGVVLSAVAPARIAPPLPRPSSIVDPRVGDLGPALLALEDGTVFPGIAFGAPIAAGGDLVVNTSQTGYQEVCTDPSYAGQVVVMTYPLIGNYGRLVDDDQSLRPWLRALVVANATAAVARRRPPARGAPARRRDPGDRRRRHAGSGATPAGERLAARDRHGARLRRSRRGVDRARAVPALGGPGLRRPGVAGIDHGRRQPRRGRPADRDRRLRAEVEHRPRDAPPRGARPDPAAHDLDRPSHSPTTSTA